MNSAQSQHLCGQGQEGSAIETVLGDEKDTAVKAAAR
jgi:hypothetical protein